MTKHETSADIITEMCYGPIPRHRHDRVLLCHFADRLEAALKRERGNMAKMCKALEYASRVLAKWQQDAPFSAWNEYGEAIDRCRAALAEPPRNCDMPLVTDGPADNNADKAWLAFKHRNPDAYFDVPGLLRCIDWLFAPATKQKGE